MRNRFRLLPFSVFLSALTLSLSAAEPFRATASDRHKVRVSDAAVAQQILAGGGRLIADYGGFQVLEVSGAAQQAFVRDGAVENRDADNLILLNAGAINTASDTARATRRPAAAFTGKRLHLVQFAGPVKPEWRDALDAAGVRVVTYIPNNAYLVYGDAEAIARVESLAGAAAFVQWAGAYADEDKIQPRARAKDASGVAGRLPTDLFAIQLVDDPEANASTLDLVDAVRPEPVRKLERRLGYRNVIVRLPLDQVAVIAAQPDVVSINVFVEPELFDERQDMIVSGHLSGGSPTGPGYLDWLYSKGFTQAQFTASGFAVDVTDSGIDNGSSSPNHFGLFVLGNTAENSRVVFNRLEGSPNGGSTIQGCDGHGTINAHIIGGYNALDGFPHTDPAGYRFGLGVCPFVRVGSSVIFDPNNYTWPDFENLISRAYRDGARISSDSWGANVYGDYDTAAQAYDALVRDAQPAGSAYPVSGNQEMTIVFAAGNAGSGSQSIGSPATGKNLITVGAAENVQAFGGSDGSGISDSGADNADDMIFFSSRGPCADGRKKPEIVAPGTHVSGGVAQQFRTTIGNGTALGCFDGSGVSGGPGGSSYFPTTQQFYTASSGTSHSCPAVAGGCALVRQYFINEGRNAPSPAMVKAYLMSSARYMTGVSANDTLWSVHQGMGHMNLGTAFDGTERVLRDQLAVDTFAASGETRVFLGRVSETGKPFRVTLAWTDAPGPTFGNAYLNDLDLVVQVGGNTYRGNVFSGSNSVTGGSADTRNNVENVFLPAGQTGLVTVTVSAANIVADGIPNVAPALDQDFALVMYNAISGASNEPPEILPVGDKAGWVSNFFQFAVTARDLVDHDVITLWAEGLPAWATFNTVTNAGGVTNLLYGIPDAVGTFTVTFHAADKDGTNSLAVNIRIREPGSCGLIISEYIEGTGNNRALELYNGSPRAIDLGASNYVLHITFNGGAWSNTIPLSGVIQPDRTFVVAHKWAAPEALAAADMTSLYMTFSGDDAIELFIGGSTGRLVDCVGQVGVDPGTMWAGGLASTMDMTLRRKPEWTLGDTNATDEFDPSVQWDPYENNTFGGLGSHSVDCGGIPMNTPPVLGALDNQSALLGQDLQFIVTATPTEGDAVTLSVSNAPGGVLSSVNATGTFSWSGAAPVGVYTAMFYAADIAGADSQSVLLVVSAIGTGGGMETFSNLNAPTDTYASASYVGDGGIVWSYDAALRPETAAEIDGRSIALAASTREPRRVYSAVIAGGVSNLSVRYRRYAFDEGTRGFDVYVNSTLAGSVTNANNDTPETLDVTNLNVAGAVILRFVGTGGWPVVLDSVSWTAFAGGDEDSDGLPDSWEDERFGTRTNTAAGDNDRDGRSNLEEYIADTNPTNSGSFFRIDAFRDEAGRIVTFGTTNTRHYGVEYVTNLPASGSWSALQGGIPGNNGPVSVTDTNSPARRVYRGTVQVP